MDATFLYGDKWKGCGKQRWSKPPRKKFREQRERVFFLQTVASVEGPL